MKTKNEAIADRGYMEFGRWSGACYGLNVGCVMGNIIRNSRHWMYGPEIVIMLRGSHTVWVDGAEHRLEAGDVLTIDTFESHEIYDGVPDGLQMIFNFDEALLRRTGNVRLALSTVGENALPKDHPDVCALREAVACMGRMIYSRFCVSPSERTPVSDAEWFQARCCLDRILMLLSRHQVPAKSPPLDSPMLLANCIREVHEHYSEPLTLSMLAERFNYSESSLYRLFRQSLNASFLGYLTSVRLNIACGMLMKNEHTVMEVSDLCGFSTYSNFYRVFKQRMGMSPTEYKEKSTGGASVLWTNSENNILYRYNQFQSFPVLKEDTLEGLHEAVKHCYL